MTDLHLSPQVVDALADAIARRVIERLAGSDTTRPLLIDASEVARRYGVTRSWAYEHAGELGAIRLGNGTKPRLRFDPATVDAALTAPTTPRTPTTTPRQRQRRAGHTSNGAPLLEIKGA